MPQFLTFFICTGLVISGIAAKKSSAKWPAMLMLIGSVCIFVPACFIIIVSLLKNMESTGHGVFTIFAMISGMTILLGILLYLIGLFSYCIKTYSAMKTNEQLDYLNFQLKDQLEVHARQDQEKN